MRLSLHDYLACGHLEGVTQGATKADIETLLGPPKAVSVETRKRPKPAIWKYDSLEIFFRHPEREEVEFITFNGVDWPQRKFVFPQEWTVDDWNLRFGQPKQSVLEYLSEQGFIRSNRRVASLPPRELCIVTSGVCLYFDEDDTLWSIGGTLSKTATL